MTGGCKCRKEEVQGGHGTERGLPVDMGAPTTCLPGPLVCFLLRVPTVPCAVFTPILPTGVRAAGQVSAPPAGLAGGCPALGQPVFHPHREVLTMFRYKCDLEWLS